MIEVTAGILTRERRILIALRGHDKARPGKWELPGGKVEAGETPEVCLKRELEEEFGIQATVGDLFTISRYNYPDLDIKLLAYWVDLYEGEFMLHVHQQIAWIPVNDYRKYDFAGADLPVMKKLVNKLTW
ncbi:MAG: (deoxy)nucleoside triphosphate pyrophosphohydrolase [Bacteroidota bacterium]